MNELSVWTKHKIVVTMNWATALMKNTLSDSVSTSMGISVLGSYLHVIEKERDKEQKTKS